MGIRKLARTLRGAAATTGVWSALFAAIGIVLRITLPEEATPLAGSMLLATAQTWALSGAIAGATYATLLVASGRHSLRQLSMPRVALWGAVAAVAIPLGLTLPAAARADWGMLLVYARGVLQFAGAGALSAVVTLALARQAPRAPDVPPHHGTGTLAPGPFEVRVPVSKRDGARGAAGWGDMSAVISAHPRARHTTR